MTGATLKPRALMTRLADAVLVATPVVAACVMASHFVARSGGRWSSNDTASLAGAIATTVETHRLVPLDLAGNPATYGNGYAYQVIAAFVVAQTGMSIAAFQQLVSPFLFAVFVAPIAWSAYRELAGSRAAATVASLLLVTQPEFLFVMLHGSHEKVTRALTLFALFLLSRSFRLRAQPYMLATHVVLFYAAAFGIFASNLFFGSSLAFSLALAVGGLWVSEHWQSGMVLRRTELRQRLVRVLAGLALVGFLVMFYAYAPSSQQVVVLRDVWDKVMALFFGVAKENREATSPYLAVSLGWINVPTYLVLTLANWLLIAVSLTVWLWDAWRWFVLKTVAPSHTARLLWLLYAAMAAQIVVSIAVDFTGALGGNLQLRSFVTFTLAAVVMAARAVCASARLAPPLGVPIRVLAAAGLGTLALLSAIKVTNEPLLSNKWLFYRTQEIQALDWADTHLRGTTVWTEFDERLTSAYLLARSADRGRSGEFSSSTGATFVGYAQGPDISTFLVTDVTRVRSRRIRGSLPPAMEELRIYDNGMAQLFQLARGPAPAR